MGQHNAVRLRLCAQCGAQEVTSAAGMALHAAVCDPDPIRMVRRRKGLCVNCGKHALPYALCSDCRFYRNLKRLLDRGAEYGMFIKSFKPGDRRAYYAKGDLDAKVGSRGFYRKVTLGGAPRGFRSWVIARLTHEAAPMSEDAIIEGFTEYRRERAERGHLEAQVQT